MGSDSDTYAVNFDLSVAVNFDLSVFGHLLVEL